MTDALVIESTRNEVTVNGDQYDVNAEGVRSEVVVNPSTVLAGTNQTTYTHEQAIPAATWIIAHGLHRYPSVTVVNSAGDTIIAKPQFIDADNIVVTFAGAFAGKAYLN